MPWSETSAMDQRTQFVGDALKCVSSMSELCERYGVSRRTGYKWLRRYEELGVDGLKECSRRPHRVPHQTTDAIVAAIVAVRRRHPSWGAKKLLKILSSREPRVEWPARSTVCDILDREGLVERPRRRRLIGHPGAPSAAFSEPNAIWCADFKGQFKTRDGRYCYPLTVSDGCTRYLLECQSLPSTTVAGAQPVFKRLFREHGLPLRIRTDNGVPFATNTLARLSRLSAWWLRLGVLPDLIEPGKPQQNGRHERMHRTLKAETTRPAAANLCAQQRRFNAFRHEYNHERPHEALEQRTPASLYSASPRPMPERLPPLEYPVHFETRYVSANGGIRWNCDWVNVSTVCAGEYVGLEEVDNGEWDVYFGVLKLGRLLEAHMKIEDQYGRLQRHHRVLPMSPD